VSNQIQIKTDIIRMHGEEVEASKVDSFWLMH
jgi:hypothetical protein